MVCPHQTLFHTPYNIPHCTIASHIVLTPNAVQPFLAPLPNKRGHVTLLHHHLRIAHVAHHRALPQQRHISNHLSGPIDHDVTHVLGLPLLHNRPQPNLTPTPTPLLRNPC